MEPLLDIRDLTVSFPGSNADRPVVEHLSLSVPKGRITALVGESGSGKSVTSLSILGLLPKQASISGRILFHDHAGKQDLLKMNGEELRCIRGNRISMIFQEPMTSLNPLMTCGDQVMESMMIHQDLSKTAARKSCIDWFNMVELPDPASIMHRYPHQLSGGQKQRIMIAMAMVNQPDLLVADEPTTALDVRVQKSIMELIGKLQSGTGMSVLLITHDLGLVADTADHIAVMYRGKLMEAGNAGMVLKNPSSEYTRALLACRPAGREKGLALPVMKDLMDHQTETLPNSSPVIPVLKKSGDAVAPLLRVENLSVAFRNTGMFSRKKTGKKIVDNVSFSIAEGEIMGLVGESGCGKTTLGRAILQLVKPASGQVWLGQTDLCKLTGEALRKQRKEMQVVFQDPYGSLNPRISIGDALTEPMLVHKKANSKSEARDRAATLLDTVGMTSDALYRYPHQFSGGQRQRICIARALSLEPRFMIFDESVSALDVSVQAQVLNLINELRCKMNLTALFISHDLSVVRYISDHILVMRNGRIIESGLAETVFSDPKEPYTRELLSSVPGNSLR